MTRPSRCSAPRPHSQVRRTDGLDHTRTWTDGELVTAAIMNPHVRDNLDSMGPHSIVRKTADQSVSLLDNAGGRYRLGPTGRSE